MVGYRADYKRRENEAGEGAERGNMCVWDHRRYPMVELVVVVAAAAVTGGNGKAGRSNQIMVVRLLARSSSR